MKIFPEWFNFGLFVVSIIIVYFIFGTFIQPFTVNGYIITNKNCREIDECHAWLACANWGAVNETDFDAYLQVYGDTWFFSYKILSKQAEWDCHNKYIGEGFYLIREGW